jgi:hypothetical protein
MDNLGRVLLEKFESISDAPVWTPGCGSPFADEHIARENQHDLEAIMRTFGQTGRYDDEPWDDIA